MRFLTFFQFDPKRLDASLLKLTLEAPG